MLGTSGFVDDVVLLHSGPDGALRVFIRVESVKTETTASVSTKFCSTVKINKNTSRVAHRGHSRQSTIASFVVGILWSPTSFISHCSLLHFLGCFTLHFFLLGFRAVIGALACLTVLHT